MKPLDLQVGIQNSYEASRAEATRIDRQYVAEALSNEDARREQLVRDESVVAPNEQQLQDDLFREREYTPVDYSKGEENSGRKNRKENPKASPPVQTTTAETAAEQESHHTGGFSTYA